ncbi:rRNA maturation RNase YbeY, partial [bacterium]|nr:rRNA maturation RNase YbeY [bacterium]
QVQVANCQRKELIKIEKIKKIGLRLLKHLGEKGKISLVFSNDQFIKKLNKEYRGINKATDVLAFAFREAYYPLIKEDSFLGEVIISVQTAGKQANDLNHSLEKELNILIIHGLLHLLGYDHLKVEDETKMREKEEELLTLI